VLVVEADKATRAQVHAFLVGNGFAVGEANTIPHVTRELRAHPHDVVIVDGSAAKGDVMAAIRLIDERVPIVMLMRTATLEQATQAVRMGADHLLTKPVDLTALLVVVQRLSDAQLARRQATVAKPTARRAPEPFVGTSRAIQQLAEQAHRVVRTQAPILIQGETGTGKGVLASWLHQHGPRAEHPFVDINCAGLSREFLESELFGYARGAFTGATDNKPGLLDVAHHGTVFLDEIGDIDLHLQPRLLKVLEDKKFRRLGDVRDRVVDVQLLAATNLDLAKRSMDGAFRADLYYRINTVMLTTPPLRERLEDIGVLARQLIRDVDVAPDALEELASYDWPGNIRELRNVLDRAVLVAGNAGRITRKDIQLDRRARSFARAEEPFQPMTIEEAEQRHVERTLAFAGGSVERAAQLLGVSRSALYKRLQRFRDQRQ
jgi:DNA-binding NtrC family response regulator